MQLMTLVLAALITAIPALAFTNGSIVPAYICHPHPDGLPKNYAQVLANTREMTGAIAFNANGLPHPCSTTFDLANNSPASDNLAMAPMASQPNGTLTGNSAYILASFHNTLNSLEAIKQGLIVSTLNGGPLVAGTSNQLNLSTPDPNCALDGAMLYGETKSGKRVGSFTDKGGMGTFADFPGCGRNREGKMAGVIHQMVVSCNVS
jgi:hypothetical protein